jgi:hypothetical protein
MKPIPKMKQSNPYAKRKSVLIGMGLWIILIRSMQILAIGVLFQGIIPDSGINPFILNKVINLHFGMH